MRQTKKIQAEILLAAYNGDRFLREQLDSILAQKDERWHLTVSDDGSSDGTVCILDEYVRRFPEKIQRLCSGRYFGSPKEHFFWLMDQCQADYILFCDQDDVWYPEKLGRMLNTLLQMQERYGIQMPILVFSDQTPADDALNPLAPSLMRLQNQYFGAFDYRSILMQNVVTGGAMACNKALLTLACCCKNPAATVMHDAWLAAAAARFGQIEYIDEALSAYRQHGGNNVGAKNVKSKSYVCSQFAALPELREKLMAKKRQARLFEQTYGDVLEPEDHIFLQQFGKTRSGPLFYLQHRKWIHGFLRFAGMMTLG